MAFSELLNACNQSSADTFRRTKIGGTVFEAKEHLVSETVNDASECKAVVTKLQDRITSLCRRRIEKIITSTAAAKSESPVEPTPTHVETFILLQRELADNVACLFVFVEHPEVEPTNNRSERNARREAEIRKGARTSKTASDAKRRSIIVTVLT